MPNGRDPTRSFLRSKKGSRYDSYNWSQFSDVPPSSTGTEAIDMAAYLKLLGESLCSIGMCLKRQVCDWLITLYYIKHLGASCSKLGLH